VTSNPPESGDAKNTQMGLDPLNPKTSLFDDPANVLYKRPSLIQSISVRELTAA